MLTLKSPQFNPCIFMDHYPANLIAMLFMGLLVLGGVCYNLVLALRVQTMGNLWSQNYLGMLISVAVILEFTMMNIFSANLYFTDGDDHHNASAVALDAKNFTRKEISTIAEHTNFFSAWILSQFIMILVHLRVLRLLKAATTEAIAVLLGAGFCELVGIGVMSVALMAGGAGDDWPSPTMTLEGETTMQKALMSFNTATSASKWFWAPLLLGHVFWMPLGNVGVKLIISLKDAATANDKPELIHPARMIGGTFRIFALLLIGTYFFKDVDEELERGTAIKMAAGFRAAPYSYFFAPVWLFLVANIASGVALTVVQRVLMKRPAVHAGVAGALWVLFMYICQLIVIPQFKHSSYFAIPAILCAAAWVAVAYMGHDEPLRDVHWQNGYAVTIVLCAVLSVRHSSGGVLLLLAFLSFEFVVPELPGLLVELEALPDELPEALEEEAAAEVAAGEAAAPSAP